MNNFQKSLHSVSRDIDELLYNLSQQKLDEIQWKFSHLKTPGTEEIQQKYGDQMTLLTEQLEKFSNLISKYENLPNISPDKQSSQIIISRTNYSNFDSFLQYQYDYTEHDPELYKSRQHWKILKKHFHEVREFESIQKLSSHIKQSFYISQIQSWYDQLFINSHESNIKDQLYERLQLLTYLPYKASLEDIQDLHSEVTEVIRLSRARNIIQCNTEEEDSYNYFSDLCKINIEFLTMLTQKASIEEIGNFLTKVFLTSILASLDMRLQYLQSNCIESRTEEGYYYSIVHDLVRERSEQVVANAQDQNDDNDGGPYVAA